jgi:Putative addiction module component
MEALIIKKQLHDVVEHGDEKLLHLMYALAKEYNNEDEKEFTDAELKEFERRRENHLNGTSKSYTWADAKEIITKGKINV